MAWQTRYAKIGVCVCWDQWYPEAARLTALRGADILPGCGHWTQQERPAEVTSRLLAWLEGLRRD